MYATRTYFFYVTGYDLSKWRESVNGSQRPIQRNLPTPLCQHSSGEKTFVPGENPRLSMES